MVFTSWEDSLVRYINFSSVCKHGQYLHVVTIHYLQQINNYSKAKLTSHIQEGS